MSNLYKVSNCRLSYECSKSWKDLADLPGEEDVKYCRDCRNTVHRCDNGVELERLVSEGRCVAYFENELIHVTGEWVPESDFENSDKDELLVRLARLSREELAVLLLINDNPGITGEEISLRLGIPLSSARIIANGSLIGLCAQDVNSSFLVGDRVGLLLNDFRHVL